MCSFCGAAMPREKPGFNEICESCGRDLHACLNCRFLENGSRWDCRESVDERVPDKEARNHCGWYETNPAYFEDGTGNVSGKSRAKLARSDFDSLFGGSG